jgi:ribosomal protein S25
MSRAQVFRWFARFQEDRKSLEDDPWSGRLVFARSDEKAEKARAMVTQDRQITTRLLAERLGVGKEAARQIWKETFRKGRFVSDLCSTP